MGADSGSLRRDVSTPTSFGTKPHFQKRGQVREHVHCLSAEGIVGRLNILDAGSKPSLY